MLDPHCDFQLWRHPWPCTWIFKVNFYPRPVMAFGYCRCLRVCVRVCLSVNHQLVRAITHQLFKLESPNLDQRCKRPWLRSLLLLGTIDLELQGQIELKSQNLPHFELVRAMSPPIEVSISKFWPKVHLSTVKVPIEFGLDWPWCSVLFLAATKQLYEWYFLSVCPSVRLSVRLSHLFDYVPIIVSSWNFQELSHWTRVRSMQKVKVRGQRSRSQRSRPNFSFPDCNSSLNSHMMMKWYI